jgi:hypothetical protein
MPLQVRDGVGVQHTLQRCRIGSIAHQDQSHIFGRPLGTTRLQASSRMSNPFRWISILPWQMATRASVGQPSSSRAVLRSTVDQRRGSSGLGILATRPLSTRYVFLTRWDSSALAITRSCRIGSTMDAPAPRVLKTCIGRPEKLLRTDSAKAETAPQSHRSGHIRIPGKAPRLVSGALKARAVPNSGLAMYGASARSDALAHTPIVPNPRAGADHP